VLTCGVTGEVRLGLTGKKIFICPQESLLKRFAVVPCLVSLLRHETFVYMLSSEFGNGRA
jgi:hypothetical protein